MNSSERRNARRLARRRIREVLVLRRAAAVAEPRPVIGPEDPGQLIEQVRPSRLEGSPT